MIANLKKELEKAGKLAERSKWSRLARRPFRLVFSFLHRRLVYPYRKRGIRKKVSTFFGLPMTVNLPAGTDIYLLGIKSHSSEISLAHFLINQLKEGMIFWDVGAHFGYFSLLGSKLVGKTGLVYSFEPSHSSLNLLKSNTSPQQNITVVPKAVGEKEGRLTLHEFPILQSEFNTLEPAHFEDEEWFQKNNVTKYEVDVVSLDAFYSATKHFPQIIKVDVEGAEWLAVKGMKEILSSPTPPILILEYVTENQKFEDIFAFLQAFEMNAHLIKENGELCTIDSFHHLQKVIQSDSENIVFLARTSS